MTRGDYLRSRGWVRLVSGWKNSEGGGASEAVAFEVQAERDLLGGQEVPCARTQAEAYGSRIENLEAALRRAAYALEVHAEAAADRGETDEDEDAVVLFTEARVAREALEGK